MNHKGHKGHKEKIAKLLWLMIIRRALIRLRGFEINRFCRVGCAHYYGEIRKAYLFQLSRDFPVQMFFKRPAFGTHSQRIRNAFAQTSYTNFVHKFHTARSAPYEFHL
jgi:hypothetical protein